MRARSYIALLLALALCTAAAAPARAEDYPGVSGWAQEEFSLAREGGLVPGGFLELDMSQPVTRQEFCQVALFAYAAFMGAMPEPGSNSCYTDCDDPYACSAYDLGIVTGYDDGTFRPDKAISRAELMKMLGAVLASLGIEESADDAETALSGFSDGGDVPEWARDAAALLVERGVVGGMGDGCLAPEGGATRQQAVIMSLRLLKEFSIPDEQLAQAEPVRPPDYGLSDGDGDAPADEYELASASESQEEKYIRIFGSLDAPKYSSAAEAERDMTEITVPVWNYDYDGVKVSTSRTIVVHKALASTFMRIFTEIYEGEERFPIYSLGGYSWRGDGTSEHNWGIAIDINPEENMMIRQGVILSGRLWAPGENKYSIPEDGEVVRIFAKYGFAWGGNAWRSSNDYMHFSYFGE